MYQDGHVSYKTEKVGLWLDLSILSFVMHRMLDRVFSVEILFFFPFKI
jgi:hypothetical protein